MLGRLSLLSNCTRPLGLAGTCKELPPAPSEKDEPLPTEVNEEL